ncbi:MAG: hypothetical protein M0C28_37560 [Candidatus Moduliflexus flocculans]|nr:hypothetical protein [Candidatus Moduliflexus flocculans]
MTGGGLIRSAGGWSAVKEAYRDGIRLASDERLLGSSEFVERTLKEAGEAYDRRMRLQSAGHRVYRRWSAQSANIWESTRGIDPLDPAGSGCASPRVDRLPGRRGSCRFPEAWSRRRFSQDRSAVSRAAQRVSQNAGADEDREKDPEAVQLKISQLWNNLPLSTETVRQTPSTTDKRFVFTAHLSST